MDIQFLKYIPTPGEKTAGIAVVRFERKFIFRFKIAVRTEGGFWIQPPSLKTGTHDGKDRYEAAFQFDSTYESDEVKNFVLDEAMKAMKASNSQSAANPFSALSTEPPKAPWMSNSDETPF